MARVLCLETDDGEVFVNLDQICLATATSDSVRVEFASGGSHTFTDVAAHSLIQALRHEEKRTLKIG
jgi:hypothetical protein